MNPAVPSPVDLDPIPPFNPSHSLDDLPFSVGDLLRRIAASDSPLSVPAAAKVDRRAIPRLLSLGFVAPSGSGFLATPDGLRWLEFVGVAEAATDAPPFLSLTPEHDSALRALLAEVGAEATQDEINRVGGLLLARGFESLNAAREPVPVTGTAQVRRVGSLLVWADVATVCGIQNRTQYARTHRVVLVDLPPSAIWGASGRPPRKGILPESLDVLELDYPIEIARVRSLVSTNATVEPTPPPPAKPEEPARCGTYVIRCTATGNVFVGATANTSRQWTKHRNDLKNNRHTCETLQEQYNTHGESTFEYEFRREFPPNLLKTAVREEAGTQIHLDVKVLNAWQVYQGRGRPPGAGNRSRA